MKNGLIETRFLVVASPVETSAAVLVVSSCLASPHHRALVAPLVWLQRLVGRRARLHIWSMNVAFELPPAQAEKLRQVAERLGISPSELARAAVTDLLAERDDAFRQAAERVLPEDAELYLRLA